MVVVAVSAVALEEDENIALCTVFRFERVVEGNL